jgi:hypothetical protein
MSGGSAKDRRKFERAIRRAMQNNPKTDISPVAPPPVAPLLESKVDKTKPSKRLGLAEVALVVLCSLIPWIFPLHVIGKCIGGIVAWALILHLAFTQIRLLRDLSRKAITALCFVMTAALAAAAWMPVSAMWSAEQAGLMEGDLVPINQSLSTPYRKIQWGFQAPSAAFRWMTDQPTLMAFVRDAGLDVEIQDNKLLLSVVLPTNLDSQGLVF